MKVCIVDQGFSHEKRYQIMVRLKNVSGFDHIYPGKLFDLEQAKQICSDNNYEIEAIGDLWHCLSRKER